MHNRTCMSVQYTAIFDSTNYFNLTLSCSVLVQKGSATACASVHGEHALQGDSVAGMHHVSASTEVKLNQGQFLVKSPTILMDRFCKGMEATQ